MVQACLPLSSPVIDAFVLKLADEFVVVSDALLQSRVHFMTVERAVEVHEATGAR